MGHTTRKSMGSVLCVVRRYGVIGYHVTLSEIRHNV